MRNSYLRYEYEPCIICFDVHEFSMFPPVHNMLRGGRGFFCHVCRWHPRRVALVGLVGGHYIVRLQVTRAGVVCSRTAREKCRRCLLEKKRGEGEESRPAKWLCMHSALVGECKAKAKALYILHTTQKRAQAKTPTS